MQKKKKTLYVVAWGYHFYGFTPWFLRPIVPQHGMPGEHVCFCNSSCSHEKKQVNIN